MLYLGSDAYVKGDNFIWFSNIEFNGLFRVDLTTNKVEFIDWFHNEPLDKAELHSVAYKEQNEIMFVSFSMCSITIFDVITKKQQVVNIPDVNCEVSNCCRFQNDIFIFLNDPAAGVWRYDIGDKSIRKDGKLSEIWNMHKKTKEIIVEDYQYSNLYILSSRDCNRICQIDLEKKTAEYFELEIPEGKLLKLVYDGDNYWVLFMDIQDIYLWNRNKNIFVKYSATDHEWDCETHIVPYDAVVFTDKDKFLINYYMKNVMRIDAEKKILKTAIEYPEQFRTLKELKYGAVFSRADISGKDLILLPRRGNMVVIYNIETQNVRGIRMEIPETEIPYLNDIYKNKLLPKDCMYETSLYSLEHYYLRKIEKNLIVSCDRANNGQKIYELV